MGKHKTIRLALLLGVATALSAAWVQAAELRDITVEFEEGRYILRSETFFEVQRESLYQVLSDFDAFEKFTSAIVESHNVEPDEKGRPQFYARMEGCILWFCKSFIRNGYVLSTPDVEIIAISDPEKSDFKFSHERWLLRQEGDSTVMIYEFEMEPAFWVPPVVGPYFMKRVLRSGGADAVDRIEVLAQADQYEFADLRQKVVQLSGDE